MWRSPRALVLLLSLIVAVACGGAPGSSLRPGPDTSACAPTSLPACERAIGQAVAVGDDAGPLVRAYVKARAEADDDDAFGRALEALSRAAKTRRAALLVEPRGAPPRLPDAEIVKVDGALSTKVPEELHAVTVALAEAAGLDYLAVAREGAVWRYFPKDPLAPLSLGLVPVARAEDPAAVGTDVAVEAALRDAVRAARAFDYVGAAKAIDRLDALARARPTYDAQTLRATVASSFLMLSAPRPLFEEEGSTPAATPPAPRPDETPYVDLLRARSDPRSAKAYAARRSRILRAIGAELHPAVDALFGDLPTSGCDVVVPPPISTQRELAFARLLGGALQPARARAANGRLDIATWYARYGELAATIERTETAWLFASALVTERGGSSGVVPSGSDVHRRVTRLALRHARALGALAKVDPGRVGLSHTGFLVASGNYVDAELAAAVVDVGRSAASGVLSTAKDSWDILGAALLSAMLSGSMPPELREAHLTALQGAFTARLRDDLARETGWGVAAAFALDGAYRALFDLGLDVRGSAAQISRALEAPGVVQPGVAALVSALVRYAALASEDALGSPVVERDATPLPGRAAARASLKRALGGLGGPGVDPDPRALDDLTTLLDGSAATVALWVVSSARGDAAKARPKDVCAEDEAPLDPRVVRALGKLADTRKDVLTGRLATATDPWSARARGVALVVSDLVDFAAALARPPKKGAKKAGDAKLPAAKLFVKRDEARKILTAGAASFGVTGPSADALVTGYGLLRSLAEAGPTAFTGASLEDGKAFVSSLGALLAESREMAATGQLFQALSRAIGDKDAAPLFVDVARGLYGDKRSEQGDMVLLTALVVASLQERAVHPSAVELADQQKSEIAWVLKFLREARRLEDGQSVDAESFVPGLEALVARKCAFASTKEISSLMGALEEHRAGDPQKARTALDAFLDRAEKDLVVPRVAYAFRQETEVRVFNLTLEIGLGAPVLSSSNSFSFGVGARSWGEPLLSLEATVGTSDAKQTRDESARTYVHAAALAGVMHFLAGDPARGEIAAARALGVLTQRTRFYVQGVTDEPMTWAQDARGALAVLGQQAAEAGRPLLAGALLGVVRGSFDGTLAKPEELAALLDPVPSPLSTLRGAGAVIDRTKATLRVLPGGLTCGGPRSDKAAHLRAGCDTYPIALALRVADSIAALPKLERRAAGGPPCADLGALDAFLTPASRGTYDPDKLTDAARAMLDAGKVYDASVLLTRQRQGAHCTPQLVGLLRAASLRMERAATVRADLLSAAVNCEAKSLTPALITDLGALDAELAKIGDGSRQLEVGLFSAKLALTHGSPQALAAVVQRPGFVTSQRDHGATALGVALLLDHASNALAGEPARVKETAPEVELLCGRLPPADRAELCRMIEPLRAQKASPAERKKAAEDALRKLLGG